MDRPAAAGAGGACCCKVVGWTMEGSKGVFADREQWGKGYVQVYLCTEGARGALALAGPGRPAPDPCTVAGA